MVDHKYRWDFIGLSTDSKPTASSPRVVNGSTYYEADTSKAYVWYKDQWYEKTATGGGGGGDTESLKVLTTEDYNYPADNPTKVGLWNLEDGWYTADTSSVSVFASRRNADDCQYIGKVFCVSSDTQTGYKRIYIFGSPSNIDGTSGSCLLRCYRVDCSTGSSNGQLYSGYPYSAMTFQEYKAHQPVKLTSGSYNYPTTGTKDGIALWLLSEPHYSINVSSPLKIYSDPTTSSNDVIYGDIVVKSVSNSTKKLISYTFIHDDTQNGASEEKGYMITDPSTGTADSMYYYEPTQV